MMNKLFSIGVMFTFLLVSCGGGGSLPSVKIGNQTWAAKNLDVTTFRNGDAIPQAKTREEWEASEKTGKPLWAYPAFDETKANVDNGKKYNWFAVSDPRGLAPEGWHVSSRAEWTILREVVGGEDEKLTAKRLKSHTGWIGKDANGEGNLGFSAFPDVVGANVTWWCVDEQEYDPSSAAIFEIWDDNNIEGGYNVKSSLLYVRCVKD
ncbi:MAG: fibrobacter succinogenes major paralogous domain-containing protein [Bacteroidia bacterium]